MPVRADRLYGDRTWHELYRALVEHDLVLGLHWGGATDGPASPTGWPSWYIEEYVAEQQVYSAQILSMISEGVFQEFPELRVAVFEIGFNWLPSFMWRLDKDWKGLRREVPWLKRPPSETLRQHFRFSCAPMDLAPAVEDVRQSIDWLESDEMLMYASDYPHAHDDDLQMLLNAMRPGEQTKLMAGTARALYRL
jgi:predicted TIM-barrel fold metal-dependent hydrolase